MKNFIKNFILGDNLFSTALLTRILGDLTNHYLPDILVLRLIKVIGIGLLFLLVMKAIWASGLAEKLGEESGRFCVKLFSMGRLIVTSVLIFIVLYNLKVQIL